MPKISFSSDNKVSKFNDYPKLKFQDKGEKARIVVLDPEPVMEWVHTLRAPVIINGEVVMESVKDKQGNVVSQQPKKDFIGQHVCFGNYEKLDKNFKDPENCPTCAAHNENPDAVDAPRRRMALHIARYKTQPGSFKPQDPFSAELLAWTFTDKVFDALVSIVEEHGDLRSKDLMLECSNKFFQNVEIQVGGSAAWLANDENKAFITRMFAENKSEDLSSLLGRKSTRGQAEEDIAKVKLKYAQAFGGTTEGAGSAPSQAQTASAVDLDDILGGMGGAAAAPAVAEAAPEAPVSTPPAPAEEYTAPAPEAASVDVPEATTTEAPAEEKKSGDVLDFDSLLSGL